jgi:hypothetical protein
MLNQNNVKVPVVYFLCLCFSESGLLVSGCSKDNVDDSKVISKLMNDATAGSSDCTCGPVINQYRWDAQIIHIKMCNGPYCNTESFFYNEHGEEFYQGTNTYNVLQDAKLLKNIWTCR